MSAYLALLLAVLSRILPHTFHAVSLNLTAVGGSLLFFGARRSRWQALVAILALAATDYYLTVYAYNFPFHVSGYLVTWAWYGAVCLLGSGLLSKKASALRVTSAVLASATSFFILSNLMVWISGGMYPMNAEGLGTCYVAAVPFLRERFDLDGLRRRGLLRTACSRGKHYRGITRGARYHSTLRLKRIPASTEFQRLEADPTPSVRRT